MDKERKKKIGCKEKEDNRKKRLVWFVVDDDGW